MFSTESGPALLIEMLPNPTPQTDAREAAHFDQPSQSRAVGRERYADQR